jgi:hypothetical protein
MNIKDLYPNPWTKFLCCVPFHTKKVVVKGWTVFDRTPKKLSVTRHFTPFLSFVS